MILMMMSNNTFEQSNHEFTIEWLLKENKNSKWVKTSRAQSKKRDQKERSFFDKNLCLLVFYQAYLKYLKEA